MAKYRTSPLASEAPGVAETITRWSGQTMGGRVPAFMGLASRTGGVYLERPGMTVAEGLRETGLDYEVRLQPVSAMVTTDDLTVVDGEPQVAQVTTAHDIPNYRATVLHYNDGRVVPVTPWVSPKYQIVQNTEALAVAQEIISGGFGGLVALGAYGNPVGAKTYAALALDGMLVGGEDPMGLFLTVTNAHDGMGGLGFRLAPMRFACTNETPLYFGRGSVHPVFTRRHTKNVLAHAAEYAQATLDIAAQYRTTFAAEAERALKVKMNENKAIVYWRQVFGVPTDTADWSPRQATVAQAREDQLVSLLAGDTTAAGRGTAWAAFNAVTEYVDHLAPARSDARRQERILTGETDALKQRAWNLAVPAAA